MDEVLVHLPKQEQKHIGADVLRMAVVVIHIIY